MFRASIDTSLNSIERSKPMKAASHTMPLGKILVFGLSYLSDRSGARNRPLLDWQNLNVDESAFKKWFDGSKIVDATGNPMVVYHGSNSKIAVFDASISKNGFWFSDDDIDANDYGIETTSVYLSIGKPAYFERTNGDDGLNAAIVLAKKYGHDGLIVTAPEEGDTSGMYWTTNYVAFDSVQIKLVTDIR